MSVLSSNFQVKTPPPLLHFWIRFSYLSVVVLILILSLSLAFLRLSCLLVELLCWRDEVAPSSTRRMGTRYISSRYYILSIYIIWPAAQSCKTLSRCGVYHLMSNLQWLLRPESWQQKVRDSVRVASFLPFNLSTRRLTSVVFGFLEFVLLIILLPWG